MSETYITQDGDQWDLIALKVYGNEKYADILMANNPALIGVYEFAYGTVLNIPELTERKTETLPEWRQEVDENG